MEQTRKLSDINFTFFLWCFGLPVFSFIIALSLIASFSGAPSGISITVHNLKQFLEYYDTYLFREFFEIFFNNYFAVLILVYFTPLFVGMRRLWQKWSNKHTEITAFEKLVLYLFPGLFLVRQAVNIAVISSGLSGYINKNVIITLAGIVLPHGLPELLAFSIAGAIGMEVTRKILFSSSSGKLVSGNVLILLCLFTALCAFMEVYFTPKIFALLMMATGMS
ncbi:MAG: hypothetical protein CVU89_01350 [Firmicutes bacterium HGW-Firmicutes-14]|jgi:uncharacterized membrane protein SpoIIM required for sporulation|nr:MAG: hypothetical protein CVU89_01350 [Firmicutes bacterium HGW-Firmicutes-14]